MLNPGRSIDAEIVIGDDAFRHWDDGWHIEPGVFILSAGAHVADLPLRAPMVIGQVTAV